MTTTVAGNGRAGYNGDGGPAIAAKLKTSDGFAVDTRGNDFMADTGNDASRKVSTSTTVSFLPTTVLSVSIQNIGVGTHATKVIVLQFSDALNPADAQSLISYSLVTVPKTKKQKPKPVALAQATYNPATFTVILTTRKPLVLDPPIQLTVEGDRLLDALGRPLNGGENFVTILK